MTDEDDTPDLRKSFRVIQQVIQQGGPGFYVEHLARLHHMQATVIRAERERADKAEAELAARELHHFEVEAENERLKALLLQQ